MNILTKNLLMNNYKVEGSCNLYIQRLNNATSSADIRVNVNNKNVWSGKPGSERELIGTFPLGSILNLNAVFNYTRYTIRVATLKYSINYGTTYTIFNYNSSPDFIISTDTIIACYCYYEDN